MANNQKAKGKIVTEYLEKYHTRLPKLTLAKLILKDNPLDFKDVDDARTLIRYYTGQQGKTNRARVEDSRFKEDNDKTKINFAPYSIPQSESVDQTPFHLPKEQNKIGVISDLHIPNHRVEPIEIALQYFEEKGVNTIILNGDVMDNVPFTHFVHKRPSAKDVNSWFDMVEVFFEGLRERFPNVDIYWLEGNHDAWYKKWMWQHAWQLSDDPFYSLQSRLHLDEYKIIYIDERRYMMAGKLAIVHGHHLTKGIIAPVNAARGVFLRAKQSTMIGHVHVSSEHTETNLSGDIVTCWSTGCMCTLTPDYQPMGGKANHGFAYITVKDDGDFHVENKRIHKNKLL